MSKDLKKLDVEKAVDDYIKEVDWRVKENANVSYSCSALFLRLAGEGLTRYTLTKIYPKEISEAHLGGDLHLHNLYMGIIGYCCGWRNSELSGKDRYKRILPGKIGGMVEQRSDRLHCHGYQSPL